MKQRTTTIFTSLMLAISAHTPAYADTLRDAVKADSASLVALYKHLHVQPELSHQEVKTAALLAREMQSLAFTVTTGVGGTGVVAVLKNGPGKTLLIRTDMDGLPVTEATGLPYASKNAGVMHACGHDVHMASWIGTARRLVAMKDQWSGTVVMIAQPAEELGAGAKAMIEDGLFTRFPRPDAALTLHDAPMLPAGTIGYVPGYTFANVDSVDIIVKGVGGHGAYPHNSKDPVVLAARIVTALQTIVSREVDPQDAAVVTVGRISGGTKRNIIPEEVKLELTIRSYSDATRRMLLHSIARIAQGEAIAAGMPEDRMPEVHEGETYTPATFNTEPMTGALVTLFEKRFGKERVQRTAPTMGGEDFGRYRTADGEPIQSFIFWLGGTPQDQWNAVGGDTAKLPSLHSPLWAPDPEPTILTGVEALTAATLKLLEKQ